MEKMMISLLLLASCTAYQPKLNATNYTKQMKIIKKQSIKTAKKVRL